MAYVTCNSLAYAHAGGDLLFSGVSFHVKPELADTLEHLDGAGFALPLSSGRRSALR